LQLLVLTAQKRVALGECEARHQEILQLEQNIRVRVGAACFDVHLVSFSSGTS
jgi:hypothetical protein